MARPTYRQDTDYFKFYNKNPKNSTTSQDCVIRAVSGALGIKWEKALRDLTEVAVEVADAPNGDKCYPKYLENLGYAKQKQPRKPDNRKYTVREFCKLKPKGTYVIRIAGHATFIEDGIIYDTWNCGHKAVGNYWKIK